MMSLPIMNMMQQAFTEHYRKFFGVPIHVGADFEASYSKFMPRVDDEVKATLEEPISAREIERAIEQHSAGKSPGPDGLGAAFYKAFAPGLAQVLEHVYTEACEKKQVPPSFRNTHIVLIPKTEDQKALLSVGSYRPISLTHTDYMVIMEVLAKRILSLP